MLDTDEASHTLGSSKVLDQQMQDSESDEVVAARAGTESILDTFARLAQT